MPAISHHSPFVITSTGKVRVSKRLHGTCPTQTQLAHFVHNNRHRITTLTINVSSFEHKPVLDFQALGQLPNLHSLTLSAVDVTSLIFTTTNTPALKTLYLSEIECPLPAGPAFALELPHLETLELYRIRMGTPCHFGQSLSRCPNLNVFLSHKLWYLPGDNLTVLPNCTVFRLIRSDCTASLEILSAPKLEQLCLSCCYNITHLRFWDLPYDVSAADIDRFQNELEKEEEALAKPLRHIIETWKDASGGRRAFEKGWIQEHDIPTFDFEKEETVRCKLEFELNQQFAKQCEKARECVWDKFVADLSQRPAIHDQALLPICILDCTNMSLDKDSKAHLKANDRVCIQGNDDDSSVDS